LSPTAHAAGQGLGLGVARGRGGQLPGDLGGRLAGLEDAQHREDAPDGDDQHHEQGLHPPRPQERRDQRQDEGQQHRDQSRRQTRQQPPVQEKALHRGPIRRAG